MNSRIDVIPSGLAEQDGRALSDRFDDGSSRHDGEIREMSKELNLVPRYVLSVLMRFPGSSSKTRSTMIRGNRCFKCAFTSSKVIVIRLSFRNYVSKLRLNVHTR